MTLDIPIEDPEDDGRFVPESIQVETPDETIVLQIKGSEGKHWTLEMSKQPKKDK